MRLNRKILIVIFFVGIFLLFHNVCYAGTQRLNSLDYNVELNEDGSMDVVETWDIYVSETNTLFKDFDLDETKYSGIYDVRVKDLDSDFELTNIYKEMYHVTTDCYYALPIDDDKFEIAWGVGLDNSSANRKYQISYTVEDAVTVYKDCSELYWQFVGTDNGISANEVTGTIKLPRAINDIEGLRVWAHGPLNGEINRVSNDTIEFYVDNFASGKMLETRIVVEDLMFIGSTKIINKNMLQEILDEETEWANDANRKRKRQENAKNIASWTIIVIFVGTIIIYLKKISRYEKQPEENSEPEYDVQVGEYFRDIPREEDSTPAEAAFLYYSNKNNFGISGQLSKVFSATLLQLCLKKWISFEETEEKSNIKIVLKLPKGSILKKDEQIVYDLLTKSAKDESSTSIEKLKNFVRKNYEEFEKSMKQLEEMAKELHVEIGNYNVEVSKKVQEYYLKVVGYVCGINFTIMFTVLGINCIGEMSMRWAIGGLGVLTIAVFSKCLGCLKRIYGKLRILTYQGENERQQWKGLAKYMEDFSLLKEREVPDLILWEKYLVYATAFGISDKVVEQLKVVYPEMNDLNYNTCSYMYLMTNPHFKRGFLSELKSEIDGVYTIYSSASGSRRRFFKRRRWPEVAAEAWEVDKIKEKML